MVRYLHNRQLAILPGEPGSGGEVMELRLFPSCTDNTGTNGVILANARVSFSNSETQPASVQMALYRDNVFVEQVDAPPVGTGYAHEFTGLADGNYRISATTANSQDTQTLSLSCYAPTKQPPTHLGPDDLLLQVAYSNPRLDEAAGLTVYDVSVWKFSKRTETHWLVTGTHTTPVGAPTPANFTVPSREPFYAYCIAGTTTRQRFFYNAPGRVTKDQEANSLSCGAQRIDGCTDPTATNYDPAATHDNGSCYYRPQKYGCTDPNASNFDPAATDEDGSCLYAPEERQPVFGASPMNSVRFVLTENVDGCATLPTPDNQLFCQERHRGVRNVGYLQKIARCDQNIFQFRSNFAAVELRLLRELDQSLVATVPTATVLQNVGESGQLAAYLKNHTNGQTRVYFNTGDIPLAVGVGDRLTVTGAGDMDGTYAIQAISQDAQAGVPYLLLNKPFTGAETQAATVTLQLQNADYNVLEATVTWSDYPAGRYFLQAVAQDPELGQAVYTSEPIDLRERHENTLVVEYRNFDNAFEMIYTTGIVNRIRVEGQLRKRLPGGEHIVHREPQSRLTRLLGVPHRVFRLETHLLPPWLHEKLAVVLAHDMVKINGVEYQSAEGYEEPEYLTGHALSSGGANVEQREWFREHNKHDLGSINQQPLLLTEGGFLRL